MKSKTLPSLFALCLVMDYGIALACDSSNSRNLAKLEFFSQGGTATLLGFDEYATPSTPPKKYRTLEISGKIYLGTYVSGDCTADPAGNQNGFDVATPPGATNFNFAWNAYYDRETDLVTLDLSVSGGFDPTWYGGQYVWGLEWAIGHSGDGSSFHAFDYGFNSDTGYVVSGPGSYIRTITFYRAAINYLQMNYNGRHGGNGSALGFADGLQVISLGPKIDLARDEWTIANIYTTAGVDQPVSTNESKRYVGTGDFPLTSGGTTVDWDGFLYAPDDDHAYGTLVEMTSETATQRVYTGTGNCEGSGPYTKATGEIAFKLSDEDTEQDALDRAEISPGVSNTAFRTDRGNGFSFQFSKVRYKATFEKITCPGDYEIYLHFLVNAHGLDAPSHERVRIEKRHLSTDEPLIVEGEIKVEALDTDYTLLKAEFVGECAAQSAGQIKPMVGSVDINWGLGSSLGGSSAGQLMLKSDTMSPAIYTPAALTAATPYGSGVEVIRDDADVIRQTKAPQALVDVVTLSDTSYELRFYTTESAGNKDPETSFYVPSGEPFVTYQLDNPDAAQNGAGRLRIIERQGERVKNYLYTLDSNTSAWTLSRGNGSRNESLVSANVNGDTVKTSTITEHDGTMVSVTARTYRTFPLGVEQIREVLDPAGVARATEYVFYDHAGTDGDNYGRLKLQINSDGSWSRHTWNASGRSLKTVRPFLNAANTAADNLCRVVENTYTTMADGDGDDKTEELTTTVETTLGQETSRAYRVKWSAPVNLAGAELSRVSTIRCVTAGAAWDAADNLVTETLIYQHDPFIGRTGRVVNPDGTATMTTHQFDENNHLTTTTKIGAPNTSRSDIEDGTCRITVTNEMGQVVSESESDIVSGKTMTSWIVTEFDGMGRPVRTDYDDGTYSTSVYDGSRLISERDRAGTETFYDYDDLGRQHEMIRQGITTRSHFDADDRLTSIVRMGTDGSEIITESNVYDLTGRLIERRDALNRLTIYEEGIDADSGETTRTTTNPDLGTVVEVSARDGSTLSVRGTAAAPRIYEYGVEDGERFTQTILVGSDNATTEWSKSYTDLAGRSYKTVLADGASFELFYNPAGQLVRQIDPDSVTMLLAYNTRGEQNVSAVDLDGDDTIDYDGSDRISRTTNDVTERNGMVVRRSTTEVWETDNTDTPVIVSVSEQSGSGMQSWQTVRGLTTTTVLTYDGSGGRTVTTTAPDQTQTVQVYTGDLLSSTTYLDASEGQLSAVTYTYDAHHRLQSVTDARNGATTYTYFDDDLIQTVTTPDPDVTRSGAGYDYQTTTYSYDDPGRVSTVTLPDGGVVNTTYYPTGQVKRTWGVRTYPVEYTYDPQGRVKTLTTWQDLAGDTGRAVITWNYDAVRGWLINKRYNDDTGPSYTFKPSGRVETRTWARNPTITTTYSYSAAGDLAGIDYSDATPDVTITYDRLGRPQQMTDGAGTREWSYHTNGQPDTETHTSGALNGIVVDRNYDSLQRLDSLSVPYFYSVGYSYDSASRLDTVTHGLNTATYDYVANSSQVESTTFRQSGTTRLTTTKVYDQLNRLSAISNQLSASQLSAAYTYNAANQRTRTTREDAAYWAYDYDALGQVTTGNKYLVDDTPLNGMAYAWTYDDIGNRRSASRNELSSEALAMEDYSTNLLNQYTERTIPGVVDLFGTALGNSTVTFTVDSGPPQATTRQGELFYQQVAVSNAGGAQRPEIKITAVQNDAGPNGEDVIAEVTEHALVAQTPETFDYDADGNLTSDAQWTYTWDAENRLVSMETQVAAVFPNGPLPGSERLKLEFAYDAQGRRYAKKVYNWNGSAWVLAKHTLFLYDGWNMIAELDGLNGNTVIRTHVWGLDVSGTLQGAGGVGGLLFSLAPNSSHHAPCFDGNGNVLGMVDMTNGSQTASYDYNAFGETVISEGLMAADNPFRFSSKYTDNETGLLYFGYRYYNPSVGRWLSRDPIQEEGGANLYGYVQNSPVEWVDPWGLALYAFDGTGNDGYNDAPKHEETNVFILYGVYNGFKAYAPGVGTNDGIANPFGLAFGAGGQERINDMLDMAKKYIQRGDHIADIIGFSRGAAQARAFANKLKEKYHCIDIRWMGLFDTVASEGLPNDVNLGYKLGIPDGVGSVLHITAGGERRKRTFALSSIRVSPKLPNPNANYNEVEVPGAAHSDVGGGYSSNRGLANYSLLLMWQNGRASNVPFGSLSSQYSNYVGTPHDSRWINDKLIEFFTRKNRVRKIYYHP